MYYQKWLAAALGVLDELFHSSSLVESGRQQISRRYVYSVTPFRLLFLPRDAMLARY